MSGACGYDMALTPSSGMRRPVALNEYVPFQPTNAAPSAVPLLFCIWMPSMRTPFPSNRSEPDTVSNGSPYAMPLSIVSVPNPNGP